MLAFHHSVSFTFHTKFNDPEGRYPILVSLLQDTEITLVSYYAPNDNPNPFFLHLLQIVQMHRKGTLIPCGDSNQVLQPHQDKSPCVPEAHAPSVTFHNLLQQTSLLDTWREGNPLKCNYTFYLYPHKSFSRLNQILLPVTSSPIVLGSRIQPIPWSDHCAVITTISSLTPQIRLGT